MEWTVAYLSVKSVMKINNDNKGSSLSIFPVVVQVELEFFL